MNSGGQNIVYLDNNATTQIAPEVFEAMVPWLTDFYGNPSSAYRMGKETGKALDTAREQIAALLKADPKEIVFTSCGTESDNAALWSALQTSRKKHIVTTQVEHSAIANYGEHLEALGYSVTWLPVDSEGRLDVAELERAIQPNTAVVSVMWANNETGVLFPVKEIAALCKKKNVLFHTDAVQTPGKIALDLSDGQIDFLSLSGHKLHAPKGVGVLYVRKGVRFVSYLVGGGQERGRRAGTENIASIVGFGRAAELAQENLIEEQTRVRQLRDTLENGLLAAVPGTQINGHREERLPNTSNLSFNGLEAEALLIGLDQHHICVSSGSACTTGSLEPSHVLTAMGLTPELAKSSLRFSLNHLNSEADVQKCLAVLPGLVDRLSKALPQERIKLAASLSL
jgi:cysteine desulfurase